MSRLSFKPILSLAIGLCMATVACGASADAPASAASHSSREEAVKRTRSHEHSMPTTITVGRGSKETLLLGTTNRSIVQVDPRSGKVMATLAVSVVAPNIVADATNIYFGAWLGQYDLVKQEFVGIAGSDGYTIAVAMAISPSGTFFASNWFTYRPDTSCGACSTVVAYLDPDVQNQYRRISYYYGYVRPLAGGEGVLSGQQIGFTDEAKLLVTSAAGDGIFVSNAPVPEVCCGPTTIDFTSLVPDDSNTTLRFARLGDKRLLVLHTTGSLDEHDLATGRLLRPVLQAGTLDPVDLIVGHAHTLYVLEKSGQVRVFSEHGREMGRITLPAAAGQAVSLALCCGAPLQGKHGR